METRYSIEEMDHLLKTDNSICFDSDLTFAKLVNNDSELLDFLTRFIHYECIGNNKYCASVWYDAIYLIDVPNIITEDEQGFYENEGPPEFEIKRVKVLTYNQFNPKPFELYEQDVRYYDKSQLKINEKVEYPCIVSVCLSDDFDRQGKIKNRMIQIIPIKNILIGGVVCL
jgi:hypothetical protein